MPTLVSSSQLTLGRRYSRHELEALNKDYQQWVGGFMAWPWLDIPFTPYAGALRARERLIRHFQQALMAARDRQAQGKEVQGLLGHMLRATGEEGTRWGDWQA